jgi:hypothetical protein
VKRFVRISINPRCETTQWAFGKKLLQTLIDADIRLTPEFVSNDEGKRVPFEGVDSCRKFWAPLARVRSENMPAFDFPLNFFWSRTKEVRGKGDVAHAVVVSPKARPGQELGKVTLEMAPSPNVSWRQLFEALCAISNPFFAMLHLFCKDELSSVPFDSPEADFRRGPVGVVIRRGIPELPWGTFVSDEQEIMASWKELQVDGFEVCRVDGGTFLFLTNDLFDVEKSFHEFQQRRGQAKAHFPPGSFLRRV